MPSVEPVNHQYPIDTAKQVRAAWSYINHPDGAANYAPDEVARIKRHIRRAAKTHGVKINPE